MGFSAIPLVTCQSRPVFTGIRRYVLPVALMILLTGLSGCASTATMESDVITVTGDITVRGNVPFHEVVLITDDNNWYILELTEQDRQALVTPARAEVTGVIRLGEWNGRPFTRMVVRELIAER